MVSASKIFKLIAFTLIMISLIFFKLSFNYILNHKTLPLFYFDFFIAIGSLSLVVGALGPLKIVFKGAQIPLEIKNIIFIQAISLPIIGLCLIGIYFTQSTNVIAVLFALTGICTLFSACFGFFKLSKTLPDTFYISEMLSIIKSAGLIGKLEDSIANKEFQFWSNGKTEGVKIDSDAPNGIVYTMDNQETTLMDICNNDETENPLKATVVNFGSYSCPHHRKRIDQLHKIYEKWSDRGIQFLTVYTAEAHPEDRWKLIDQYIADKEFTGNKQDFCFYSAKTIDDRKQMANWLIEKKNFKIPIVLDNMDNTLLKSYNSWPIRLYVIEESKVVYCGEQGPFGYSPDNLDKYLETNY